VSIVGPSGCGKTTLLWSMSGLHRPLRRATSSWTARPSPGRIPRSGSSFRRPTCCPGATSTPTSLSLRDQAPEPDREWIDHLLDRVGLKGFGGKFPRELSGGMQQRAAIVRALALALGASDGRALRRARRLHPRGDEPAGRGDLAGDATTIVFITHSIEEAIFLSDKVVVLTRGRAGC
jgi:NitT/TauT family transport system ATP-binding protein